ncbi:MAG: glycosyltransferase family 4 protein [Gammaproteobacteria bacterium]
MVVSANTEQGSVREPGPGVETIVESPLRVLCLNYEYPPMGGGAGNATRCIATELARRGHQVHVLTSRLPAQPVVETVDSVTVCRVWSLRRSLHQCGLFGAASYIVSASLELTRLARTYRYDVYHFYFGLPTAILALYVHFVLRRPYVLALRGSDVPGYDYTKWYMRPLHVLLRPLSRFLWRTASSVTVLSKNLQALAGRTDPNLESIVIGNGIDSDKFPAKPPQPGSGPVSLITVCRMVPRKGLEYLIDAMTELKKDGIVLELVGSGQEQQRVRQLVRERGLEAHVILTGYVPAEKLYTHYHRADVFVLPSLSESFGQVLLEAMSCGLPIVATSIGGIPETVRDKTNGLLIPPRDPAALVAAVRWLAANRQQRERMGRYNAEQARARYTWSAISRQYESLYYRAVGAGPGQRTAG